MVVVDNGSHPAHYETFRRLMAEFGIAFEDVPMWAFPRLRRIPTSAQVHVVRSVNNLGYGAGNNLGFAVARWLLAPDYCVFMNSDVRVAVDPVPALVEAFATYPHLLAAMPLINTLSARRDPRFQIQLRRCERYFDTLVLNSPLLKRLYSRRLDDYIYAEQMPFVGTLPGDVVSGCFFMVDCARFGEIGGFDERVFLYHEEVILGYRMKVNGYHAALVADVCVQHEHRGSTGNATPSGFALSHQLRSQAYYAARYERVQTPWVLLLIVLRTWEYSAYILALGRLSSWCRFLRSLWRERD
jgi:GT2 family glycosyltransferase